MGFQYSDWSCYRSSEPDLVLVDKRERSFKIIDFAVPGKGGTEDMEC